MEQSRRHFLQKTALGLAGTVSLPLINKAAASSTNFVASHGDLLPVGIAGYTFNKFDLEKSIAMMKRINVKNLSLKEFHLPINSNDEKIKSVMAQFAAADINVYAVGVIYMKTKQAVDDAFNYAKKVGVNLIVGVPEYELIDYTEQKVKETNIRIAIHNHGPEDKLYPGPQQVYDRIKNRDSRMGLCLDIGHAERAGTDLVKAIKEYRDRLYDLHIKDVSLAQRDGKAIEIGRGVIDFDAVIKALKKNNYKGMCSIEFEKDMSDPLPGIAESIGFFRGVMSTIS
ncbi:MAG: sugar phosphate isomerase/epimerase [Bacteroidota bacterium]|nr:sugar phosphate isomerase/epimerase [Bacteroidota bacterium]